MTEQQRKEQQQAQIRISNRISSFFLSLIGVLSLLAAGALVGFNTNNDSSSQMPMVAGAQNVAGSAAPASTVTVAMHDPGCHSFKVGNSYMRSTSVTGPVNVVNADEAALKIVGASGAQTDDVGQQVSLAPGTYTITMVGQASDDNTLHLAVS